MFFKDINKDFSKEMVRHIFGCHCSSQSTDPRCIKSTIRKSRKKPFSRQQVEKPAFRKEGQQAVTTKISSERNIYEITSSPFHIKTDHDVLIIRHLSECEIFLPSKY